MKEFIVWENYTQSYGWRVTAENEDEAREYFFSHPDEFTGDNYSEEFVGDDCSIEVEEAY